MYIVTLDVPRRSNNHLTFSHSIGMVLYCLLNPSRSIPYWCEFRSNKAQNFSDFIISRMNAEILPECDSSYNAMQVSHWRNVFEAYQSCLKVRIEDRPSLNDIAGVLAWKLQSKPFPLEIHQGTALEQAQKEGMFYQLLD